MTTTEPHALYRFYDDAGTLLYVGITVDPSRRLRWHASMRPWWQTVALIRVEWHPNRTLAQRAETHAIQTEQPAHNRPWCAPNPTGDRVGQRRNAARPGWAGKAAR